MKIITSIFNSISVLGLYNGLKKTFYSSLYRKYANSNKPKSQAYLEKKHALMEPLLQKLYDNRTNVPIQDPLYKPSRNVIWMFWWQGEDRMPEVVKKCVQSVRKHTPEFDVIVLSKDNLNRYIILPSYIVDKIGGAITFTHLSDLVRVALISTYGGGWIDATLFLTDSLPDCVSSMPYYTIKNKYEKFGCISSYRWTNGFMFAQPNNTLITQLYQMLYLYWREYNNRIDYFLMDYCENYLYEHDEEIRKMIDAVPFSNPRIFKNGLSEVLTDKFDECLFKEILSDTWCHRLSYKVNYSGDHDTFIYHILNDYE